MKTRNSLSNNKILDWSKFKAFADDKINVTENFDFGLGTIENIVGKGENADLTLSQTTKFRLFQIERVCRRRF